MLSKKVWWKRFFNTYKTQTMISIKLLYCCKKVFPLVNIWMVWKNAMKLWLSEKENFYSNLNMEDITDADYAHGKRFCKDFKIKKFMRILWFVCSKHYIFVSWCIWKTFEICVLKHRNLIPRIFLQHQV